jgi:aminoglycoside 3-N-acetyltransferase
MSLPNTLDSLRYELRELGLKAGMTVMTHSSLGQAGWTVGGPVTVIRALLDVIGTTGTLVMPAESPQVSDPSTWSDDRVNPEWYDTIRKHLPVFDARTTPTTLGVIPEAFRTFPGTLRSNHPLVSVCANGPLAEQITVDHALEFCEGEGTPFEKLFTLGAVHRFSRKS